MNDDLTRAEIVQLQKDVAELREMLDKTYVAFGGIHQVLSDKFWRNGYNCYGKTHNGDEGDKGLANCFKGVYGFLSAIINSKWGKIDG